ncbi:LuxR C-terminal-related transcriptional regulator [Catenulispora rubra]|uniref:LuxR C-terminal-related transcriptional regulator n=1 Tax=Catenulispora rubra TaxID=280293 RepID=UPI0018925FA5|nr:response regulator transcription factor [Catenulispora rubra]
MTRRVRVVGIDDDTIMRDGLALLLTAHDVTATFPSVTEFLRAAPRADVVLVDLKLSGTGRVAELQGQAAVRAVAGAGYPVLVYTNERRRAVLVGCLAAGARGVVHKAEPLDALADAVSRVAEGHTVITQALTGLAELAGRRGRIPSLSPRQREVLAGRARGESFAAIAARLFITPKTTEEHMAKVTEKFAEYLRTHSPADLERHLGLDPAELSD